MKRLLLVLPLLLVGCGGGSSDSTPAQATVGSADAQTLTVDMDDKLKFSPSSIKAQVGVVTFDVANVGLVPHNLIFKGSGLGKTGTVDGGTSEPLKITFDKAGTFDFVCSFHPTMKGKVAVS